MTEAALRKKITREALKVLDFPYKRGAYLEASSKNPSGFDCSSLVQYLYQKIEIEMPRSTIIQATQGTEVSSSKLLPGDLIFFEGSRGHYWYSVFDDRKIYIGHVALYIGNGEIIETSEDRGGKVVKQKLADFIKKPGYEIKLAKRIIGWENPIYNVPAYSQIIDIKDSVWQRKSCGITSLKMVMDFWLKKQEKEPDIDNLIKKHKNKAYVPSVGWSHQGLAAAAKQYGFVGKNYDLACYQLEDAFPIFESKLRHAPVIASVYKDFNPKNEGHLIVVAGIKNKIVFYNEPNSKSRKEIRRVIGLGKFLKGWKKRFLVIHPQRIAKKQKF